MHGNLRCRQSLKLCAEFASYYASLHRPMKIKVLDVLESAVLDPDWVECREEDKLPYYCKVCYDMGFKIQGDLLAACCTIAALQCMSKPNLASVLCKDETVP